MRTVRLWFSLTVLWCAMAAAPSAWAAGTGYFYAYFKGGYPFGGHSGVFLSYTTDGLHFESLNNNEPVFVSPDSWGSDSSVDDEDQTRDPSVVYGPDGLFHMVWTSGINTRSIGYASSPNLRDWTPQLVDIWDQNVTVNHTWAPEIFFDDVLGEYRIVFASDLNGGDHKLYSITTSDFSSYSSPEVYYYDGNTVIDGVVAKDAANNRYLMALKDERGGAKNISLATSLDASAGSWTTNNPVIVGPGSAIEPNQTEGPSLLKIDDTWFLYYDAYTAGYLGVATSTDPTNPNSWVNRTTQSTQPVGPTAHHGTVVAAPIDSIAFDLLPYGQSDLNHDETIDLADWMIFFDYHLTDLSGLTDQEQADRGDLNGDGLNNYLDFRTFKSDYDVFNGSGAFQAMLRTVSVPEPASCMCLLFTACASVSLRLWRSSAGLVA